ncbi:MAG: radical SAM protein, partial [Spirochaetota bacterium]|nr:radical SAM protein [Spirochaetota bacterium]
MEKLNNIERKDRPYRYFKATNSLCPHCLKIIRTKVIFENNKVYFVKFCPEHGHSKALVSEDAKYYENAYSYSLPGSQPLSFETEVRDQCPNDCGLCTDHEQHTCMPIIEITDHCNLDCPICIVDNNHANNMSVEDFKRIVDNLLNTEGRLDNITLSGGEPSNHPKILEILDIANKPDVARVAMVTNGIRIAKSDEFCQEL